MAIGIIGGGIMGMSLGYFLTKQGVPVEIYEASPVLGGLAGPLLLADGTAVDRFYHAILSSDSHLRDLCHELGIADQLRFQTTKMGFYHNRHAYASENNARGAAGDSHSHSSDAIYPMNGLIDFLRFPPLNWPDRLRLGLTVLAAQSVRNWQALEGISIEDWLIQWGGQNTYDNLWRPLLRAKFDGGNDGRFDNVPATWIWSRLVRMKSTRSGANQKEEAGHLIGGYATLMEAMAAKIRAAGGKIHLNCPVQEVITMGSMLCGLRVDGRTICHDTIVCTMQAPVFGRLIPSIQERYRHSLEEQEYLGIVCPLLVLDRPLTGYWTVNMTDETVPFTGIVETTTYIDPSYVGGNHLVYLPKYTAPDSQWLRKCNAEIEETWLHHLCRIFPHFDPSSVREFRIHRERFVEPLRGLNEYHKIPAITTPVADLYLVTTAQIYPALTNGESVSRYAQQAATQIRVATANSAQSVAPRVLQMIREPVTA